MMLVRRPVARMARVAVGTAVVAGTAGVVNHKMDQHYANQANQANAQAMAQQQQQQMADMQAQQEQLAYQQQQLAAQQQAAALAAQQQAAAVPPPAPAPQVPAPSSQDQQIAELQKWAELQKQGIITPEEFAAKKAQILGI